VTYYARAELLGLWDEAQGELSATVEDFRFARDMLRRVGEDERRRFSEAGWAWGDTSWTGGSPVEVFDGQLPSVGTTPAAEHLFVVEKDGESTTHELDLPPHCLPRRVGLEDPLPHAALAGALLAGTFGRTGRRDGDVQVAVVERVPRLRGRPEGRVLADDEAHHPQPLGDTSQRVARRLSLMETYWYETGEHENPGGTTRPFSPVRMILS